MAQPKSRKKDSEQSRKTIGVTIRYDSSEHEKIKQAAKADKRSFNSFVVLASLKAAKETAIPE